MTLSSDQNNDVIKDLADNYNAKLITVDPLIVTLEDDYFNIMTDLIENIKLAAC